MMVWPDALAARAATARRDFMMHWIEIPSNGLEMNARTLQAAGVVEPLLYKRSLLRLTRPELLDFKVNHYTCVRIQGPRTYQSYKPGLRDEIKIGMVSE